MRILHTIARFDIQGGGPSQSVYTLVNGTRSEKVEIEILTYLPSNAKNKLIAHDDYIYTLPSPAYTRFGYSTLINKFLEEHHYDIYYCNGLWQYPSNAAARFAQKNHIPYVFMPHGMLYPEGLRKSKWIKKLSMILYQESTLKRASIIHVTCRQELENLRSLGFKNQVALIPNPISVPKSKLIFKVSNSKVKFGFIGRFAPIKNIEILIKSWQIASMNQLDCELLLVGDGDPSYKRTLENLVSSLGLHNVKFMGFLIGQEKEDILNSLDYLVLPSKSENFGMVVPEALIRGIPVIASTGTPWEELNTRKAGWWIETGVEPLAEALKNALQLNESERQQLGLNGRRLVEENYSIESVAHKMVLLYNWILKHGDKPEFVYL